MNPLNRGSAGPQEQGALDQVPVHRVRQLLRGHLQAQRPHDEAQRAAVQVQVQYMQITSISIVQGVPLARGPGLGWVDFDLGSSSICPILLRQMGFRLKWLSNRAR